MQVIIFPHPRSPTPAPVPSLLRKHSCTTKTWTPIFIGVTMDG